MNMDMFECPICVTVFQGPIYQCKNGHVVCAACSVRIHGTCPSCREPVGDIRCRALENVIAGMAALPCSFRSHGCTQQLKLTELRYHKALCQHAPFACPFPACAYSAASAPLLYDHIQDAHSRFIDYDVSSGGSAWRVSLHWSKPFKVLLDPVERRVYLLLNGVNVPSGRSLSVVRLGPHPAADESLVYKLEVGGTGAPGALSLSAKGLVATFRSWEGRYLRGCLVHFSPHPGSHHPSVAPFGLAEWRKNALFV